MNTNIKTRIEQALIALGVTGKPRIVPVEPGHTGDNDRYEVYINGAYFGIWDGARKTFVD